MIHYIQYSKSNLPKLGLKMMAKDKQLRGNNMFRLQQMQMTKLQISQSPPTPKPKKKKDYVIMIFDRLSSHYIRYLDQFVIIEYFNKRDKVQFKFIYQILVQNQSSEVRIYFSSNIIKFIDLQLIAMSRMLQGREQNDYKYFKLPSYLINLTNNEFSSYIKNHQYIIPNIYPISLKLWIRLMNQV
ncbi:unnamed protein product [Paramecium pentaurelia]|uniref:Uncharacterized protein n=1 Tax=Paramecium pentaurelia TaxID=43138 RepID=A0A8S1UTG0_9CILI|nr:unnamed protein product [Paramecium pentaurelia]